MVRELPSCPPEPPSAAQDQGTEPSFEGEGPDLLVTRCFLCILANTLALCWAPSLLPSPDAPLRVLACFLRQLSICLRWAGVGLWVRFRNSGWRPEST